MNPDVTFSEQSQRWLEDLASQKRKPISPATRRTFGAYVRRLTPMLGEMKLADINNGALKQLVQGLDAEDLSPKTIAELIATVKQVIASAVDDDGNQLFPRTWSAKHIDAPTIGKQHQPCLTLCELEKCIKDSRTDQERVFYALLAGTGLRVSECLAIRVGGNESQTTWDKDAAVIRVRATIFAGQELQRTKTPAAVREVDLDPQLNALLERFVALNKIQPGGYLLQARNGRVMNLKTAKYRLAQHNLAKGFHSFRRLRISRLRELGVPEDIIRYWVGHAGQGITDRYSKLGENVELRRQWCTKVGLGFQLPELRQSGHPDPSSGPSPRIADFAAGSVATTAADKHAEPATYIQPCIQVYIASDDDLDPFFRQESA
jgi:integrase